MKIEKTENFNEILQTIRESKQKDLYLEVTHDI
jgi:hypothetical protein